MHPCTHVPPQVPMCPCAHTPTHPCTHAHMCPCAHVPPQVPGLGEVLLHSIRGHHAAQTLTLFLEDATGPHLGWVQRVVCMVLTW